MAEIKQVCLCGDKEEDHALTYCNKCSDCGKYTSIGIVEEQYIPITSKLDPVK
jgi:hypothetical protein